MKYQGSTQSNVKLKNQELILKLLLAEGPMTRADLAKKMNSSKPTISKNVEDLLVEKKVIEIGKDDNMVGKGYFTGYERRLWLCTGVGFVQEQV